MSIKRVLLWAVAWFVGSWAILAPGVAVGASFVPSSSGGKVAGGSFISLKTLMPSLSTPYMSGGVATGGVVVTEALGVALGTGSQTATASMTAARTVPWATVARIGAKALGAGSVYGTIGLAVYALVRCRGMTSAANLYGGGLECDPGVAPTAGGTADSFYWHYGGVKYFECAQSAWGAGCSLEAAGTALASYLGVTPHTCNSYGSHVVSQGGGSFQLLYWDGVGSCQPGTYNASNISQRYSGTMTTQASCQGGVSVGIDGKCPTGTWQPKTAAEVAQIAEQFQQMKDQAKAILDNAVANVPGAAEELDNEALPTTVQGPATVNAPAKTTTTQVGSNPPTTKTETPTHNVTYSGDTYNYTTTVVTVEGSTTTTTTQAPEIEVCGLPNTPPCKIDETGTPTGSTAAGEAATKITAAKDKAVAQVDEIVQPTGLGWAFSLSLPSGACNAFQITTNRFGTHQFWTPCGNPNVELMRSIWAWAVGIMAAAYIWWRVNETIQGQ